MIYPRTFTSIKVDRYNDSFNVRFNAGTTTNDYYTPLVTANGRITKRDKRYYSSVRTKLYVVRSPAFSSGTLPTYGNFRITRDVVKHDVYAPSVTVV